MTDETNPFLELQRQRLREPNVQRPQGFGEALRDSLGSRRKYSSQWMKAWRAVFGNEVAGSSVGLDAWYPLRETMTAADFIARYVPRGGGG
jgi:hypothetical protein